MPTTLLLDDDMRDRLTGYYSMLAHTPDAGGAMDACEYVLQVLHLRMVIGPAAAWTLVPLDRPTRPFSTPESPVALRSPSPAR